MSAVSSKAVTSSSSTQIWPASGRRSPQIAFSTQLLPAPPAPMRPSVWPVGTVKLTSSSTVD